MIGVDESSDQIAEARHAAEHEGVKLELHHAPLAELAFVRADTIDAVVSAFGLAAVDDLDRVFRQVDRVLRPEHHFVLSLPHPGVRDDRRRRPRAARLRAPTGTSAPIGVDVPRTISCPVHEPRSGQLPGRRRAGAAADVAAGRAATAGPT